MKVELAAVYFGSNHVQDMARHKPVEQHAQRGQALLNGGRGKFSLQLLDEGGDVQGLHAGELADAVGVAPGCKAALGIQVSNAGGKCCSDVVFRAVRFWQAIDPRMANALTRRSVRRPKIVGALSSWNGCYFTSGLDSRSVCQR
jgi:hypothetical protein